MVEKKSQQYTTYSHESIEQILFRLSALFHITVDMLERDLFDTRNLTMVQGKLLFCLFSCYPDGAMLKDLAKELDVSMGFCSATVEALVQCGLVERSQKDGDRRAVLIQPSEWAKQLKNNRDVIIANLYAQSLEGVSQKDIKVYERVASKLYQNLQRINLELQNKNKK